MDDLTLANLGVGSGLGAYSLADPNATDRARAFAAAQLASKGSQAFGGVTGSQGLSNLGQDIGTAAGLAGAGYGIYDTATNPNLSTGQKAGHSAGTAINTILSLLVPYYGIGVAARAITGAMRNSGSPEVRGAGQAIAAPALPVEGLLDVLQGDRSPRAAANNMVQSLYQTPVVGGAFKSFGQALGLGTKPTTGTLFRRELGSVFGKLGIKGADMGRYNVDLSKFSQDQIDAANRLGMRLSGFSPTAKGNPKANYQTQATAILLNSYGKDVVDMEKRINSVLDAPQK